MHEKYASLNEALHMLLSRQIVDLKQRLHMLLTRPYVVLE